MQVGSEDFAPPAHLESIKELLADRNKRVDLLYHVILNASEGTRRGLLSDMQCLEMRSVAERFKKENGSELLATILSHCSPAMQQGLQRDMLALTQVKVKHSDGADEDLEFYCRTGTVDREQALDAPRCV